MYIWAEQLRCWGLSPDEAGWSIAAPETLKVDLRQFGERRGDTGKFQLGVGPFHLTFGVECLGGNCYRLAVGEETLTIGGNRAHGSYFIFDENVVKVTDVDHADSPGNAPGPDGGRGNYRACFQLCW